MVPASLRHGLRYYFIDDRGMWRLPHALHRKIIAGSVFLPRFGGTRQKLVEVHIRGSRIECRGVVYSFTPEGRLDLGPTVEAAGLHLSREDLELSAPNVVDLAPEIKKRKWRERNTWRVPRTVIDEIANDLSNLGTRLPKLPLN